MVFCHKSYRIISTLGVHFGVTRGGGVKWAILATQRLAHVSFGNGERGLFPLRITGNSGLPRNPERRKLTNKKKKFSEAPPPQLVRRLGASRLLD